MLKLFNMKRLLAVLFVFLTLLLVTPSPISAAGNILRDKQNAIKEGGNQEGWLSESFASNAVVGLQVITGPIPDDVLNGTATSYIPGGLIGFTTSAVAALYTPPASGVQYLASLRDGFLGKPAYAQNGGGFAGLQPILPIWRGFRNIVYLLSSLVFIIIGVMIMLRVKISPQAVVTVQNAVPQLITTLILVTFSYAIAGLLVDLMAFLQGFVIALLFEVSGKGLQTNLLPGVKNYSFDTLTNSGIGTYADLTIRALPMTVFLAWGAIFGAIIGGIIGNWIYPVAGVVPGAAIGGSIVAIVVTLVIGILIIVWMFKFYFGCLKAYVTIIFKIVVAPLELAMGAFPNSKMGFSSWIWDLFANLAIFPISIVFLLVGNIIIDVSKNGLWAPPVISNLSLPSAVASLGGLGLSNIISVGIGLAVVGILSQLPTMIPEFIFSIKPSPWGKAIGEGLYPKSVQGTVGMARGLATQTIHDRLMSAEAAGGATPTTAQQRAGTAGRVFELFGWAKGKH